MERVNKNIVIAFKRSGLTDRAFADVLGAHEVTLLGWLEGVREPDLQRAFLAARALGVTIDELVRSKVLPRRAGTSEFAIPEWSESIQHVLDTTDWTISKIYQQSGVARSTVCGWRSAAFVPRLPVAFEIADMLGHTVHAMCDGIAP